MIEAVFADRAGQTPQDVERRRKMAEALMAGGHRGKAPQSGLELAGRLAMTLMGQYQDAKADKLDTANRSSANQLLADTLLGSSPSIGGESTAPTFSGGGSSSGPQSYRDAIASIESAGSGDYSAVGPTHSKMGRALGRYQIMEANLAPWGQEALGRPVTAEEFLANPKLQDAIFDKKFGSYVEKFGPSGAAQAWFAGPGGVGKTGRKDVLGTSVGAYADKFNRALGSSAPVQVASLDPSSGMADLGDHGPVTQLSPQERAARLAANQAGMANITDSPVPRPVATALTAPQGNYPEQGRVAPVDWTDQPQLSAAPGMQFAGGRGGIMAQPMQGAPQPPEAPNQAISEELLRKNDLALGGIMAPPGAPQPQGAALGGAFPTAPTMTGNESLAPQPDYMDAAPQFPAAPAQPNRRAMIAQLLGNPYTAEAGQQLLMQEYKRQQEANDPANQLDMEYKRAQLAALKAKDDGADYKVVDKRLIKTTKDGTVEDVTPEAPNAKPGQFRFEGTSVEAQALNGLMDSGTLTPDQAQQLAAGKTITDPQTGAIVFLTPRGIFSQPAEGGPAMPVDTPQGAPASPATPPAGQGAQPSAANPGIIPLTEGKPGKLATEGERRNRSLYSVVQPELKVVEDNYAALSDPKNQAFSKLPFSEYMTTKEYQQAANSLQTIVSSYLYSVSGATATPDEVKKQTDILTPRPGEKKESIDNKLRRVRTMVDAIRQSGGNWVPPAEAQMPDGVDPEIWNVMTPEEKALFQ